MKQMKRISILIILMALLLSGCSIRTPIGTFTYDSSMTSDNILMINKQGKTTVIQTDDLNSYLNSLLDTVSLPTNTTKENLTDFICNSLNTLGIDINKLNTTKNNNINIEDIRASLEEHNIDTSDMTDEEVKTYIEDFVKQKLEEQGINIENFNLDFSIFFK